MNNYFVSYFTFRADNFFSYSFTIYSLIVPEFFESCRKNIFSCLTKHRIFYECFPINKIKGDFKCYLNKVEE